jgi:beta-lactamase class A
VTVEQTMRLQRSVVTTIALLLALAPPAARPAAAQAVAGPLARRVSEIAARFVAEPAASDTLFHPDFLAQIPVAQLTGIFQQFHAQAGAVVRTVETSSRGADYGEYRFETEKGMSFPAKIGIESGAPNRIDMLWFGSPQSMTITPGEIIGKLKALHGRTSLAVFRLDGAAPRLTHGLEPDAPLAIGSTFKLYVLGALAQEAAKDRVPWERVVRLDERFKPLPSGVLQSWPAGTPLTVQTLACEMISTSDNTATDHLLRLLGRAAVEAVQKTMGHATPERNVPFLTTRELFQLKEKGHAERMSAYLARDAAGRRAYLDDSLSRMARTELAGFDLRTPVAIDRIEWFASTADLCRAMSWLRVRTEGEANRRAAPARAILAINPGVELDRKAWTYVGYKGGSEPGVLNMTWLLGRRDGAWFAVSASWNDEGKSVDTAELATLMQSLIGLLATGD